MVWQVDGVTGAFAERPKGERQPMPEGGWRGVSIVGTTVVEHKWGFQLIVKNRFRSVSSG